MKSYWLIFATLVWGSAAWAIEATGEHLIGAGDVVAIETMGEDDLSKEIKVDDNGAISFPFIGELKVAGLTTRQLQQKIHDGLKGDYLIEPKISVSIATHRPFYVNGEVRNPGAFNYVPGMTVRKAISLAGGMTDRASSRKIFRVSESGEGKPQRLDLDSSVAPGDTITVEQSFF